MNEKFEFTIENFRQAIAELCDDRVLAQLLQMSDEELLNAKMREDLGLDSLSQIELTMMLEKLTGHALKDENFDSYKAESDGTVRYFLNFCSYAAS